MLHIQYKLFLGFQGVYIGVSLQNMNFGRLTKIFSTNFGTKTIKSTKQIKNKYLYHWYSTYILQHVKYSVENVKFEYFTQLTNEIKFQ